jgi:hypothetical protein
MLQGGRWQCDVLYRIGYRDDGLLPVVKDKKDEWIEDETVEELRVEHRDYVRLCSPY